MKFKIEDSALENFRSKYAHIHPLVFQRSLEKASSSLQLFEILEGVPSDVPYSWDESKTAWSRDEDVMAVQALKAIRKRKS